MLYAQQPRSGGLLSPALACTDESPPAFRALGPKGQFGGMDAIRQLPKLDRRGAGAKIEKDRIDRAASEGAPHPMGRSPSSEKS